MAKPAIWPWTRPRRAPLVKDKAISQQEYDDAVRANLEAQAAVVVSLFKALGGRLVGGYQQPVAL